jgi:hypothetical protein
MNLSWQTIAIPLASGVSTGSDPRALNPPALAVANDVEFEEAGGIQTRKPFAALADTFADGRKLVAYGDELVLFTKNAIHTWSERDEAWIEKAEYFAPAIDEAAVFVRTSEQTQCDRAEFGGCVFYAWLDTGATTAVHVAVLDKATGAVLLPPTSLGTGTSRPRLLAMTTKVILFVINATGLATLSLDPDDLEDSATDSLDQFSTSTDLYYDVATNDGVTMAVVQRNVVDTTYRVTVIGESFTGGASVVKARTCDGPIAVAISPAGDRVQVVRANDDDIEGDLLNATTLADVHTAQAIGTAVQTPVQQVTAAYRTVTDGGVHRCYVFWTSSTSPSNGSHDGVKANYVATDNTLGTAATLSRDTTITSRAFDRGGDVFVWIGFNGRSSSGGTFGFRAQLQNTYFLLQDTGRVVAKAAMARAGGFSEAIGHLPGVQEVADDVFAWCGTEQRIIDLGGKASGGFGANTPRDVVLTFDSDDARRCVRLGRTLYIAGGQVLQYDGEGVAEVGFHVFPWIIDPNDDGTAGAIAAGDYTYKATYRWDNAKGEIDRSTTASSQTETVAASRKVLVSTLPPPVTLKHGDRSSSALEIWRTTVNPTVEAPFYLVTSKDPSLTTGDNQYGGDDGSLFQFYDNFTDAIASTKEVNPENGGTLESLAPPPARVIAANEDRVFLGDVAGDPDRVWYSKLRGDGEVASFHDALTIDVPPLGGRITAIEFLDETLIVFREAAIYAFPGDGFNNLGEGQNFGPSRRMSADCGAVNAESVAVSPAGIVFKSRKGWYVLDRGGVPQYIGERVSAFDDEDVHAVHVVGAQHQVRCVLDSRILVFDYKANEWSPWTESGGLGAAIWDGTYHYLTSTAVKAEQTAFTSLTYGMDVETPWIKVAELQGYFSVDQIMVLGEHRSACRVRARVAYNLKESDSGGPTWVDDKYFTSTPATVGGPLQFRHGPRIRQCTAIKVRLTAYAVGGATPPTGEALRLTGISLKVGIQQGLYRGLPAAQQQ